MPNQLLSFLDKTYSLVVKRLIPTSRDSTAELLRSATLLILVFSGKPCEPPAKRLIPIYRDSTAELLRSAEGNCVFKYSMWGRF